MYSEFKEVDVEVSADEEESSEEEYTSKLWVNINLFFAIIPGCVHQITNASCFIMYPQRPQSKKR
jgi:hypothetical protein